MSSPINRRTFLKAMAGLGGAALLGSLGASIFQAHRSVSGRLLGPSRTTGHHLRDHETFPEPGSIFEKDVVIIGGGIAGLSAGWWLKKHDIDDFQLLEMEQEVGGNSRNGKNAVSAYPWGAHYIPLPGKDARYVHMLFEELGIIRGYDSQNNPVYEELFLCHDPEERLLKDGRWQEGLVPKRGLREEDEADFKHFFDLMHAFKIAVGSDGRKAFTIPLDLSSQDEHYRKLDRLSMTQWLRQEGFHSKALIWYVNYCCRDDYGATADQISAWAGIHYYTARDAKAANAESNAVLTWPEGNGWLVNRLKGKISQHIRNQALVYRVANGQNHVIVDYMDQVHHRPIRIKARQVIFAGPRFVGKHIIQPLAENRPSYLQTLEYAPWMVANVSLSGLPPEGEGEPLSWDNVSYNSPSLGYVVATHQNIRLFQNRTVLTCYWPLTHKSPREARQEAQERSHSEWTRLVAEDLEKMHPGIRHKIEAIDVWVWGHGMIKPSPSYIWGPERQEMLKSLGNIHFAHSDMSGISIFEEAQYRGVQAAEKVIHAMRATT